MVNLFRRTFKPKDTITLESCNQKRTFNRDEIVIKIKQNSFNGWVEVVGYPEDGSPWHYGRAHLNNLEVLTKDYVATVVLEFSADDQKRLQNAKKLYEKFIKDLEKIKSVHIVTKTPILERE